MKKLLFIIAIASGLLATKGSAVDGYVTSRPDDVVYERGVAPGPDYVWIDGDWVWGGGRYTWRQGRWDHARPGRTWHAGSWSQGGRGYHWNRGHW